MCKCSWENCGCSYLFCLLVTIVDVSVSIATLLFWTFALYEFKSALSYLEKIKVKEDVAWYAMISLPIVAFIGLWNGIKLFNNLRTDNFKNSGHICKALVFFIAEGVGFALPFFIFADYMEKITLLTVSFEFIVLRLMEVNPVTIALFVYQILSFFIVVWHKRMVASNKEIQRNTVKPATRKPPMKTILAEIPTYSSLYTAVHNPANLTTNSYGLRNDISSHSSSSAVVPSTLQHQRSSVSGGFQMYPDLNDVRVDLMALSSNYVINIQEHEAPYFQRNSFAVDPSLAATLRRANLHSQSEFQQMKYACVRSGRLYEDPDFPATNASLGSGRAVQWKRPCEISRASQFITDGVSRFDVRQGELGDCWFLAAIANLTLNDQLFRKVVPEDNEWAGSEYGGICHFWFHVDGNWKEVIIDDRLPTRNGKLVYLRSTDGDEFWSALLEKAYAKLNGNYYNLSGNDGIGRAMINLTGGEVTRYMLDEYQSKIHHLFDMMKDALDTGKMVGCCTIRDTGGIPGGHAYSVTHISKISLPGSSKPCSVIRIRNPWGNEEEWKGQFGDSHPAWKFVDEKTKKKLELIFRDDGEFWFPLKKLAQHFHMVEICQV